MSNFNEPLDQPPLDQPPLEESYRILKINFKIFLIYTVFFSVIGGIDGMFVSSIFACIHSFILFLIGFVMLFFENQSDKGASTILVSFLLAGIGFSFCSWTLESIL